MTLLQSLLYSFFRVITNIPTPIVYNNNNERYSGSQGLKLFGILEINPVLASGKLLLHKASRLNRL